MIQLVVVCDKSNRLGGAVIPGTGSEQDRANAYVRIAKQLQGSNSALVAGPPNQWWCQSPKESHRPRYLYLRPSDILPDPVMHDVEIVRDVKRLSNLYLSDGHLAVLGGLSCFEDLLPFADMIDVIQTNEDFEGGDRFDGWDSDRFMERSSERWEGGRIVRFVRRWYGSGEDT